MSLYRDIRSILLSSIDEGEASAITLMLMEKIAGIDRLHALMGDDSTKRDELLNAAKRIAKGEPVQYVIGEAEFCGLHFVVKPGVLIPRPETEELVNHLMVDVKGERGKVKAEGLKVLDIGTGSGCIAVSLAKRLGEFEVSKVQEFKGSKPKVTVEAWDVSNEALLIAKENAERNSVDVKFEKVDVLEEKVKGEREKVKDKFDIIVSNPPYICNKEAVEMEKNVLDHEPHLALFVPDDDPLLFYRRIAELGKSLLNSNGKLYFEINRSYGKDVVSLLTSFGYENVNLYQDQFGNDRIVNAIKP